MESQSYWGRGNMEGVIPDRTLRPEFLSPRWE
jgi:hypothetical protein